MARTCAMSCRISSSDSGSFLVMMRSLASASMGRNKSHSLPSTSATKAAFANPGPMEAAISPGVTPRANVSAVPSGKVTETLAEGAADTGFLLFFEGADHREPSGISQDKSIGLHFALAQEE